MDMDVDDVEAPVVGGGRKEAEVRPTGRSDRERERDSRRAEESCRERERWKARRTRSLRGSKLWIGLRGPRVRVNGWQQEGGVAENRGSAG